MTRGLLLLAALLFSSAARATPVDYAPPSVNGQAITPSQVTVSSAIYAGISVSTQAAGGAGALVTVTCPLNSFAFTGGCSCTGGVATTAEVNMPSPTLTVPGAMPTGWQCQQSGTTGGACAAFVLCSLIRF